MAKYYDRYKAFKKDGQISPIPGIVIPDGPEDKQAVYKLGKTRLDILSQKYYGNPYHGWLIMLANQQYGGLEWNIPDGEIIRIPFPFTDAINRYNDEVERYIRLYG